MREFAPSDNYEKAHCSVSFVFSGAVDAVFSN
jgi:hypothetical protein